jgi:hypothetical protein
MLLLWILLELLDLNIIILELNDYSSDILDN